MENNAVPILDTGCKLLGFRGVDRDITDRLEAEEKLAGMEARLAHVGRLSAMGEMMAGITHELVQPLHAISIFADAIMPRSISSYRRATSSSEFAPVRNPFTPHSC